MDIKHLHIPTARTVHDGILQAPFWGWPTATIDWCEESKTNPVLPMLTAVDYTITPYIAEFINTITNAFFSIRPLSLVS